MQIYCICAWYQYYPDGGLGNIKDSFTNYEIAIEKFDEFKEANKNDGYDYMELRTLDVNTGDEEIE